MNLNELAKEAHQIAVEHGFWSPEPSFGDLVSLMHSELSEALEEYRAGRPMVWHGCMFPDPESQYECEMNEGCKQNRETCKARDKKPEGIAVELADCIIRILDRGRGYGRHHPGEDGLQPDATLPARREAAVMEVFPWESLYE